MTNNRLTAAIRASARSWKRIGCLASEVVVRDEFPLPIPHSDRDARWCVFVTWSIFNDDLFVGEYPTQAKAMTARRHYEKILFAAYDAPLPSITNQPVGA